MSKPLDYYAGYPNQQRMPKWVGITLGSLFGGMLLIAVAVGARLVWPARTAEASVIKPLPQNDQPILAPAAALAVAATDEAPAADAAAAPVVAKHRHHGKHGKVVAMSGHSKAAKVAKNDAHYKKAQLYAKHVSTNSRRDKKSRDELDRLLGM